METLPLKDFVNCEIQATVTIGIMHHVITSTNATFLSRFQSAQVLIIKIARVKVQAICEQEPYEFFTLSWQKCDER